MTHRLLRVLVCWAAVVLGACEHPLGVVTPHIEAADLVVADSSGAMLTRTDFNRRWVVDSLVLRDGESLRIALTPIDFRGQPIDLSGRTDLSCRLEAENGALVQWEPQRGFGWLRPFAVGRTRVRFLIWHDTHADFVTPWLRIVVRDAAFPVGHPSGVPDVR
jgi:hypothetical protein